jgi:hypothetical protein
MHNYDGYDGYDGYDDYADCALILLGSLDYSLPLGGGSVAIRKHMQ